MTRHIPRIYTPLISSDFEITNEEQIHHMFIVMRIKKDDKIIIFNEKMGEFITKVERISRKCIKVIPEKLLRSPSENNSKLSLAFGIIKNDPLSWMIEKVTELGVTDLFPIITDYTNFNRINKNRCEKIMVGAAEQSGRLNIPRLHEVMNIRELINKEININWKVAMERTKKQVKVDRSEKNSGFIVGPEGGFSDREKELLLEKFEAISLSEDFIFKTETAAIACIALTSCM